MNKITTAIAITILAFLSQANAQTFGNKRNITLKLMSYQCGDYCGIDLKDVKTGVSYGFDNIDEKTKDFGILETIQNLYYKNGESDKGLVGKIYKAVIEYRKTDVGKMPKSTDEPRVKTAKKKIVG